MSLRSTINNTFGDTIIEVMVVLAILGSGIAISYSSVSRSLSLSQDAKERMEATQLLQTQIEYVREAVLNPNSRIGTAMATSTHQSGNVFCFTNSASIYNFNSTDISNMNKSEPIYPKSCTQSLFSYYIVYTENNSAHIFDAESRWPSILGQGQNKSSIVYEVYAPAQY